MQAEMQAPVHQKVQVGQIVPKTVPVKTILESPKLDYQVRVGGWVRSARDARGGRTRFIGLCDGSSVEVLQIVISEGHSCFQEAMKLTTGASLTVLGTIVASMGSGQDKEMQVDQAEHELRICGLAPAADYPLAKKAHSLEYLRAIPHLRARTRVIQAITRVRSRLFFALHQFYQKRGYVLVNTPILTSQDCEGGGDLFKVLSTGDVEAMERKSCGKAAESSSPFFPTPAFLTCSGQLSLETYACGMSKTYTFGPTFRAENSHTSKHLSEFWMLEPEVTFVDLAGLVELVADTIKDAIKQCLRDCREDLEFLQSFYLGEDLLPSETAPTTRWLLERLERVSEDHVVIHYKDALRILKEHFSDSSDMTESLEFGVDLSSRMEMALVKIHKGRMVFVVGWPAGLKAFYMKKNASDGLICEAMDCLVPHVGEVAGGSTREDDVQVLLDRMKAEKMDMQPYESYLDLRRYGSVPHAGYGLGFDRLVSFVTGTRSIRDCIPYPRAPGLISG